MDKKSFLWGMAFMGCLTVLGLVVGQVIGGDVNRGDRLPPASDINTHIKYGGISADQAQIAIDDVDWRSVSRESFNNALTGLVRCNNQKNLDGINHIVDDTDADCPKIPNDEETTTILEEIP